MGLLKFFIYIIVLLQLVILATSNPTGLNSKDKEDRIKRWALTKKEKFWPDATVYYKFVCTEYSDEELKGIESAMQEIMDKTCVKFMEIDETSDQKSYVKIVCEDRTCSSTIGYLGTGAQTLNLRRKTTEDLRTNCLSKWMTQQQLMHALGFYKEHTSFYRDSYITIEYDNIEKGWNYFFEKYPKDEGDTYGCEFDYNSVMMPTVTIHSKNDKPTIVPKNSTYTSETIGIAEGISDCDVTRINNMYCLDTTTKTNSYIQQNL